MKTIIWDFDNTLVDTTSLLLDQFLYEQQECGVSKRRAMKMYKHISLDEKIKIGDFLISSGLLNFVEPIEGARDVLSYLSYDYKQKCLTARPNTHSNIIKDILTKNFGNYISETHFLNSLNSKIDYAYNKMEGIVLIDDTLTSFEGIEKTNYKGILFDPKDEYKTVSNSHIKRTHSLDEIPDLLSEIFKS